MPITPLTVEKLAHALEHTFLKPYGPASDIDALCEEALDNNFGVVAVNPAEVDHCARLLKGSQVGIVAAVSFPLGQTTLKVKEYEINDSISRGATDIDMVINIRALQDHDAALVRREIQNLVRSCKAAKITCKVILETCYLSDEEKRTVCKIALEEGADFVKTSTGFGSKGGTVHDVKLMRSVVGDKVGIKVAGGVRDLKTALAMIEAGAVRIGTSSSVQIINDFMSGNNAL